MNNRKLLLLGFFLLLQFKAFSQALRVSKNGRYLETSDAQPFLWLGDTAWELFHKLSIKEAFGYLKKRKEQGFTVIQAVILAESDGLRTANANGDLPFKSLSPEQPNEAYFKHIDQIVNKAKSLGLYIAILPTWADKVPSDRPGSGPIIFNSKNAARYGSFLADRYTQDNVIWILGGDRNVLNDEVFAIWKAMGQALKRNKNQLLSYHPAGESSSSRWFQHENWVDFNMYQSGHAHRFMPVYRFAFNDYHLSPTKPTIEAEPAYEDIPVEFWAYMNFKQKKTYPDSILKNGLLSTKSFFKKGYFTDYDIRVHAYWNLLSGACGYTYGHNAVWQMFSEGDTAVIPSAPYWNKALDHPGATQIKFINKLFSERSFADLVPDQDLIKGVNPEDSTHIRAARAADSSFAIFYTPSGKPIQLSDQFSSPTITGWWYNPRNGSRIAIKQPTGNTYTPPIAGTDWVLVIDKKSRKF